MPVHIIKTTDPDAKLYITEQQITQEYHVKAYTAADIARPCLHTMVYLQDTTGTFRSAFDREAVAASYQAEMRRQSICKP